MGQVIFCKTRWPYQPYSDLFRLVELSDYPTIYVDELDAQSDNTYIITPLNGEWQKGWKEPKARIIHWDLEWRPNKQDVEGVSETWASDVWYADRNQCRYVTLGSHPGLNPKPDEWTNGPYDVAMLAYMTHRRGHIAKMLEDIGLRVGRAAWDDKRHAILSSSKAYVYVCQSEDYPVIAPQRWAMAAAYRLPIISERVANPGVFEYMCLWADYPYIPFLTKARINDSLDYGSVLYNYLCVQHTFRKCVEAAL